MGKDKKKNKQKGGKTASRLKDLAGNPVVAELVAAALVSTAAALKNPNKAKAMAADAQDELTAMAKEGARKGTAMWQLALDVGRQALETLVGEPKGGKSSAKPAAKAARKAARPAAKAARAAAKPAAKAARKAAKPAAKTTAKTARKSAPRGKPAAK